MNTDDDYFDYDLPHALIAQEPLPNRVDARLMVVDCQRGEIEHHHIRDLPYLLSSGDRLVLNNTKVIPAQLVGRRTVTGGRWQGLFLQETEEGHWRILCKTRGRLAPGEAVTLEDREGRPAFKLWLIERLEDGEWLAHPEPAQEGPEEEPAISAYAMLEQIGRVPLPPYIRGGRMVDADVEHYQTVFAKRAGAVAAPTAGLHFTADLLCTMESQSLHFSTVTLHVGLGTFRPISGKSPLTTEALDQHVMHSEWGELTAQSAADIGASRQAGQRVVAVGTTALRVLETAAAAGPEGGPEGLAPWQGETDLFIRPSFQFRAADALLTNFHFPRTTLLVLVQAFAGRELIQKAYEEAIREAYRFYSYGDAMLILR